MRRLIFYISFASLLFAGCNPTKRLQDDQKLLNKVKIKSSTSVLEEDELYAIVKQKPNRRILGFIRFHLGVYNMYKSDKESKIKETIGEAPVIYDSTLTEKSRVQLSRYLGQEGFFENEVTADVTYKKKKVNVRYNIEAGPAYTIDSIAYRIKDPGINNMIKSNLAQSKLKPGMRFNIDKLEEERQRLVAVMRNNGYFDYSADYLKFEADSTGRKRKVKLYLTDRLFRKKLPETDSVILTNHTRYYINNIHVYMDANSQTATHSMHQIDPEKGEDFFFHYIGIPRTRPKTVARKIFFKPDELFRLKKYDRTYKRLTDLGVFRSINIKFQKVEDSDNQLDVIIELKSGKSKSVIAELQGTNNNGNLGIYFNTGLQHRNLFRGAENLALKIRGGLQSQPPLYSTEDTSTLEIPFFNTYEFGPELEFHLHRFLLPIREEKFSKNISAETEFKITYNYQQRVDYSRHLLKGSMGYSWNETPQKRHVIYPIDLSLIKLDPGKAFKSFLDTTQDAFIYNSYKDHLIPASSYSFIFKNNTPNKQRDFSFFRFNFEVAGNFLRGIDLLTGATKNVATQHFELFDIRYSQYVMADLDYRHYFMFQSSSFATRAYFGYAVPYGNTDVMPFQRAFFSGGANEMRAWQTRSLGPGSVPDSLLLSSIDEIGDMKFETNLEYRFDLTKLFEMALFLDAGNIWLRNDPYRPAAQFAFNKLWRDLAMGTGVGFRFDFTFFIIRLDVATRIKDPGSANPEKVGFMFNTPPNLNLGIGYPF